MRKIAFIICAVIGTSMMADEVKDANYFEGYPTLTRVRQQYASMVTNSNEQDWWLWRDQHPELKVSYVEELMAYLRHYMVTTNVFPGVMAHKPHLFSYSCAKKYDAELADLGCMEFEPSLYVRFPHVMDNVMNSWTNLTSARKVYIKLVRSQTDIRYRQVEVSLLANYYACSMAEGGFISTLMFSKNRKLFQSENCFETIRDKIAVSAGNVIKRKLREDKEKGIGNGFFVGPDGVNPVEKPMKDFIAALQAPKCAGLKEWIAIYFPDYEWVEPEWRTDKEIEALKDEIYWGEKKFGLRYKIILSGHLGLEGFNEFVKKYNN